MVPKEFEPLKFYCIVSGLSHWALLFCLQEDRALHIRRDHDIPCPCVVCGVSFSNRANYKRHLSGVGHLNRIAEQRIKLPERLEETRAVSNKSLVSNTVTRKPVKEPSSVKKMNTGNILKSPKLKLEKLNEKDKKVRSANNKVKPRLGRKVKSEKGETVTKRKNTDVLKKLNYCSVCKNHYKNMNIHLKTEKHYKAAIDAMKEKKLKRKEWKNKTLKKGEFMVIESYEIVVGEIILPFLGGASFLSGKEMF